MTETWEPFVVVILSDGTRYGGLGSEEDAARIIKAMKWTGRVQVEWICHCPVFVQGELDFEA